MRLPQPDSRVKGAVNGGKETKRGNDGREKQIEAERKTLERPAQKNASRERTNSSEVNVEPSGQGSWAECAFLWQPDPLQRWLNGIMLLCKT